MPSPTEPRPHRALFLALWLGLAFTLGASGLALYRDTPLLENGDQAVNALQIDNAKYLRELHGNYSRFEFNHPGPAFFYVYAAGEWVFYEWLGLVPTPGNAHLVACMLLQSAFFALALVLLASHLSGRIWLPLTLVLAAWYFGTLRDPFLSIWPPYVLLMPFLCFLTACVSVASGQLRHLPIAVLCGGFLVHGHVAQPLMVGGLGGLMLAAVWRKNRAPGSWRLPAGWMAAARTPLVWSAAIAGIFLLPLALDIVFHGTRGNVATIIGTFFANTSDSKNPLQSFLYFLSFGTFVREQDALFSTLGPQTKAFFVERSGLYALHAALIIGPLVLLRWRPARFATGERLFLTKAYLFLGAATVLCVLWGLAQAGGMHHFNGFFYYGVYFFAFILALAVLSRFVDDRFTEPTVVAICCCAAIVASWTFRPARPSEVEAGVPLRQGIENALAASPVTKPILLRFEHYAWPQAASVALDLKRRGADVYTTPWWNFMFGKRHDETRLGPEPESQAVVWWVTVPAADQGHVLSPELSLFTAPAPIEPAGAEIHFSEKANGYRYVVSGLTAGNVEMAWTDLPRFTILFEPRSTAHDVRLVFEAQSNVDREGEMIAQPGEVYLNGQALGTVVVNERAAVSVVVPREVWNGKPTALLEVRFPQARPTRTFKRPGYVNWRAWGLWAVRTEPAR